MESDWDTRQYLQSIVNQADEMLTWPDELLDAVRHHIVPIWYAMPDDRQEARVLAEHIKAP